MLRCYLNDTMGKMSHATSVQLGQNLMLFVQNKFDTVETQTAQTFSTLLDPRLRQLASTLLYKHRQVR